MAVTVTVAVVPPVSPPAALRAASLLAASLARFDSMPVPAARPTTATDKRAMMHERMKTIGAQPHIFGVVGFVLAGMGRGS